MKNVFFNRIFAILAAAALLASLAGCSGGEGDTDGEVTSSGGITLETVDISDKTQIAVSSLSVETIAAPSTLSGMDTQYTARDKDVGYEQSTATVIKLKGDSAEISGEGASSAGGDITINAEGSYVLSGAISDGTIFIDAGDTAKVQLVLDGASISCSDFAAIFVKNADKVFITLSEGKLNNLADGSTYTLTEANSYVGGEQKNVDAVIYSRCDLSINGSGTLNVIGNYKHAIVSKDELVITGGVISISAPNGGLYGNDSVKIGGGTISVTAGSDGIRADNNTETDMGFVYIDGGSVSISAGSDGIQAATAIFVAGGSTLVSAAGEPVKCGSAAIVTGGTLAALGSEFDCPVSASSTQHGVLFALDTAVAGDTRLSVAQSGSTSSLASFKVLRSASALFFTSPGTAEGTEYALFQD